MLGWLFRIGLVIAEDLTDLLLLDFLFTGVFVVFVLSAGGGGEDHVVDKLVYALTVGVV